MTALVLTNAGTPSLVGGVLKYAVRSGASTAYLGNTERDIAVNGATTFPMKKIVPTTHALARYTWSQVSLYARGACYRDTLLCACRE